jgi:hypothetical protein
LGSRVESNKLVEPLRERKIVSESANKDPRDSRRKIRSKSRGSHIRSFTDNVTGERTKPPGSFRLYALRNIRLDFIGIRFELDNI